MQIDSLILLIIGFFLFVWMIASALPAKDEYPTQEDIDRVNKQNEEELQSYVKIE